MKLRTLIAALVFSVFVMPASGWADFEAGMKAYDAGDFERAFEQFSLVAQEDIRNTSISDEHRRDAKLALGWMQEHGEGVPKDKKKAVESYGYAALGGSLYAVYNLGILFDWTDFEKAKNSSKQLYEKILATTHVNDYRVQFMLQDASAINLNYEAAKAWWHHGIEGLRKSVAQHLFHRGDTYHPNPERRFLCKELAIKLQARPYYVYDLGRSYKYSIHENPDLRAKALAKFKQAYQMGYTEAAEELAEMYYDHKESLLYYGQEEPSRNYLEAFIWRSMVVTVSDAWSQRLFFLASKLSVSELVKAKVISIARAWHSKQVLMVFVTLLVLVVLFTVMREKNFTLTYCRLKLLAGAFLVYSGFFWLNIVMTPVTYSLSAINAQTFALLLACGFVIIYLSTKGLFSELAAIVDSSPLMKEQWSILSGYIIIEIAKALLPEWENAEFSPLLGEIVLTSLGVIVLLPGLDSLSRAATGAAYIREKPNRMAYVAHILVGVVVSLLSVLVLYTAVQSFSVLFSLSSVLCLFAGVMVLSTTILSRFKTKPQVRTAAYLLIIGVMTLARGLVPDQYGASVHILYCVISALLIASGVYIIELSAKCFFKKPVVPSEIT